MYDRTPPTPPSSVPPAWWERGDALARFVADLLAAEFALARPGRLARRWPEGDVDFVRDLGADSLDVLALGTALAEALHLQRADVNDALLAHPQLAHWLAAARAGLAGWGRELTFRTSGSSGAPKRCTHPLATLWQETCALADLLPGRRRILNAVPSHHIYGFLFTILLPVALAADEVVDLRAATPAALARTLQPGDLVVAHPGWWEALLRLDPVFASDVAGVTSTAPCPAHVADGLSRAGLRLLEVYGSSETGGIGWRDAAASPFALLPHWSRAADTARITRRLPDGTMVDDVPQDHLAWEGERSFRPAGRVDAAVQVGGVNVFPGYVADVLRMHPSVREATVRLMRPDEGSRLKAYVVPAPDVGDDFASVLDAWAGERLSAPERPAAWTFGPRLPRQASGKPADWIIDAV